MKILMLNYELAPIGGGAGNATYNIAKELVQMGHEVDILTSKTRGQDSEEERDGIRIYRVFSWRNNIHDCGLKGAYTYVFNAASSLRKLCKAQRYDVLHYFFGLPTGALTLLPGHHKEVPTVISLRGSDVPYYDIYNKKVHILNMGLKPIIRYIWEKTDKVVALSEGLKQTARKTAPYQEMDVTPNGVETDLFRPGSRTHNHERFNLLTVSRLVKRKGIDYLLEALSEINDQRIKLLIVGTGPYEQHLKDLCRKLNLNASVKFFGYCERTKLVEFYNQSDVFVLPSLAESFGLVFAEAMACGLPVIGGNTGGVPDLIGEENGILVEPGNVSEIKNAILKLLSSQEIREKMGKNNRQKMLVHYSWRNVAVRYVSCYESVSQRAILERGVGRELKTSGVFGLKGLFRHIYSKQKEEMLPPLKARPPLSQNTHLKGLGTMGQHQDEPMELWTAKRRANLVLRVLKGEMAVEEVARQHRMTVAEVEDWQDQFLRAAENGLRRQPKNEEALKDEQIKKLERKIGHLVIENEVLREALTPYPVAQESSEVREMSEV